MLYYIVLYFLYWFMLYYIGYIGYAVLYCLCCTVYMFLYDFIRFKMTGKFFIVLYSTFLYSRNCLAFSAFFFAQSFDLNYQTGYSLSD